MKVAMYYRNDDVRIEEMPVPKIGPGELLVKVTASGICGSDVMEWYRIKKAPRVLGHEVAAEIVEVGEGVQGFHVGQRVVVTHHVPCNNCLYCQRGQHTLCDTLHSTTFDPGGFAEYLRVPAINVEKGGVVPIPDEVSNDAATFTEPLGCAVRGMREIGFQPARTVLVLGSGLAGMLNIKLAKALGAGRIIATDINDFRLDMAKKAGAEVVINAAKEDVVARVWKANGGRGADYVIVCAAAPPVFRQALDAADRGATILLFAILKPGVEVPFHVYDFWHRGLTLKGTYAAAPRDLNEAMELLRTRRVEVEDMITHRLPLEQAQEGFRLVAAAKDSMKVILYPHGVPDAP